MSRSVSIADEIFTCLDMLMQKSDTDSHAKDSMLEVLNSKPSIPRQHLSGSEIQPESELFKEDDVAENKTDGNGENVFSTGLDKIFSSGSQYEVVPLGNNVINSTASTSLSVQEEESICNMHLAAMTDGQHTQFSNQGGNHSGGDDLKKMLQEISNKPSLIDRLIGLLQRKIQCDYTLIEFFILFHQKVTYDIGNQRLTSGMQSESPFADTDVLQRLIRYDIETPKKFETTVSKHGNNNIFLAEQIVAASSQSLETAING